MHTHIHTRTHTHTHTIFLHYPLHFHLWHILSLSVCSPSNPRSKPTIMVNIQHTYRCPLSCKHRNIRRKIFSHHFISLEQFALPHTHTLCHLILLPPSIPPNTGRQQKDANNDVRGPTKTVTGALSVVLLLMMMTAFHTALLSALSLSRAVSLRSRVILRA